MPHWTFERCRDVALQCSTRMEFFRRFNTAYHLSSRNGWFDEITAHMPSRKKTGPYKWTEEKVTSAIGQCATLAEFRQKFPSLYGLLHQRGALDRLAHLDRGQNPNGYWTKERCAEVALECVTRGDFAKRFPAAADAAYRNGWTDEICAHMQPIGDHKRRAVYVIKVKGEREVYVGISAHPRRRYGNHLTIGLPHVRALICKPHKFKVVTGYLHVAQAVDVEKRLIAHFERKGWTVANRHPGGGTGVMPRKWTRQALFDLAATMETRSQMMREHVGAYGAACDAGILDDLFAHHPNRGFADGPIRDWDEPKLREIAKQCVSRPDMKRRFEKAWQAAYRRGLLDTIFADHPNQGRGRKTSWTEAELVEAARPYASPAEFRRGNRLAHRAAESRGLLPVLFSPS